MQGGALNSLRKPFSFPIRGGKLVWYAQRRARLGSLREADQRTVDRVFGALRAPDQLSGVKGRSVHTLEAVEQLLADSDSSDLPAAEVADRTGMSRATPPRSPTHPPEPGRLDINPPHPLHRPPPPDHPMPPPP